MARWSPRSVVLASVALLVSLLVIPISQSATAAPSGASRYYDISPERIMDTRSGVGVPQGIRQPGSSTELRVTGVAGVPSSATAVVLNVTLTESIRRGYVEVFPTGQGAAGTSSNLNVPGPDSTVPNLVVVPVGGGGKVTLYTIAGGHLIADVFGYFSSSDTSAAGRFVALPTPKRTFDSRETAKLEAGESARLPIYTNASPDGGVVPPGASAVVVNVTATGATKRGYLQLYASPDGAEVGAYSNLNFPAQKTAANLAIIPIGDDGAIEVYALSEVHVIADVIGYFTGDSSPSSDAGLFVPLSQERLVDTRELGGPLPRQTLQNRDVVSLAGLDPDEVAAMMLNVTLVDSLGPGYLEVFPTGKGTPGSSSTVNVNGPGATRANAAISGVANGEVSVFDFAGGDYILDASGYFTVGEPDFQQSGKVLSGTQALVGAQVQVVQAGDGIQDARVLGTGSTDAKGEFSVSYTQPSGNAVLYLIANGAVDQGGSNGGALSSSPVRLATVLGRSSVPASVVINERTTVATAYAMAQFIDGDEIGGPNPGMPNAALTFRNIVDVESGGIGDVLNTPPNGGETSALRTVNALANMTAACVRTASSCVRLFDIATSQSGVVPQNTLDAMVDIAHDPGSKVLQRIDYSENERPAVYLPALRVGDVLDPGAPNYVNSLVLALRYDGAGPDGPVLDGPGNIAFDGEGNAWINNNFAYSPDRQKVTCGSTALIKLTPDGKSASGSPFGGNDATQDGVGAGGLYGAGYGIAVDASENVWVTNFGFQGIPKLTDPLTKCPNDASALAISVSEFDNDGNALSPDGDPSAKLAGGYIAGAGPEGEIGQPQGVLSDRNGNVWVAGCINGTVTRFNNGDSTDTQLMTVQDSPLVDSFDKAFAVAIDHDRHAWVTGNSSSNIVEIDTDFNVVTNLTTGFDKPMGIAADSAGNMWVSNAALPNPPCPPVNGIEDPSPQIGDDGIGNGDASISLIDRSGDDPVVITFGKDEAGQPPRDGLRWPWGIAVDGNDNVWVANFAGQRIMQMCGAQNATCPAGKDTGDPISPDEGYFNNGLDRVTAVQIDPSGNVWLTNNYQRDGIVFQQNPGGLEVVVFVGQAAPVTTPMLGPPERP